jgi:hypothetical protein
METILHMLVLADVLGRPQSMQHVEQGVTTGPLKLTSDDAAGSEIVMLV